MREILIKIATSVRPLAQRLEDHCSISYAGITLQPEEILRDPVDCLLYALEFLHMGDEYNIDDCFLWLNNTHSAFMDKNAPSLWDRLAHAVLLDLITQLNGLQHSSLTGLWGYDLSRTIDASAEAVEAYLQLTEADESLAESINERILILTEHSYLDAKDVEACKQFADIQNSVEKFLRDLDKGISKLKEYTFPEKYRLTRLTLQLNKIFLTEPFKEINEAFSDIEQNIAFFSGHKQAIEDMGTTMRNFLSYLQSIEQMHIDSGLYYTPIKEFYEKNVRAKQPYYAEQYSAALALAKDIKPRLNKVTAEIDLVVSQQKQSKLAEGEESVRLNEQAAQFF